MLVDSLEVGGWNLDLATSQPRRPSFHRSKINGNACASTSPYTISSPKLGEHPIYRNSFGIKLSEMSVRPFDFESASQSAEMFRLNIRARNEVQFLIVGALLNDRRKHHANEIS